MNPVLVISARDNVATALEPLAAGRALQIDGATLTTCQKIPRGHKVAIRAIRSGDAVVKYGNPIGTATTDIAPGAHVHIHNVSSARGRGDLAPSSASAPRIAEPLDFHEDGPPVEDVEEPA